jgi:hypothetical protein
VTPQTRRHSLARMSSRASWAFATAVALVSVAHLALGCSSSTAPAAAADAEAICPATVADVVGAACAVEGLVCFPQYACGILPAIASCTCAGGAFACTDVTGKSLAPGSALACPAPMASEACPATEMLANQHSCTEPGLECAYPSTCPSSTDYDQCECFTGALLDGGTGLRFECPSPCDSGAVPLVPLDAATPPNDAAPADAQSTDAHADASPD